LTPADASSLAFVNNTDGGDQELDIELDIIQETISDSEHYQEINATAAVIGFCLRVDYNYSDGEGLTESINFYETNVTITVDLTAGFELTDIVTTRTSADSENANLELDYPVTAYACSDDNIEDESPDPLAQGSFLQVCVKIDGSVQTKNIIVEDILTFTVSQPGGATASETITNASPDALTDKVCRESGICNVKTQLLSKFFAEASPGNLLVTGTAILAFGSASLMPSSAPSAAPSGARRLLRAPIRGLLTGDDVKAFMAAQQKNNIDESGVSVVSMVADSSQRMLQDGADQSEFGLEVGLQGINGDSGIEDSDSGGSSTIVVAAIVLIMLAAGGGFAFYYFTKRSRKEEPKDSNANAGTYPGHASVHTSSSSNQHISHRVREQID
jgi:hypothetical protein